MPETTSKDIIRAHQRRLNKLEIQRAERGAMADPAIDIEIEDIYQELTRLMVRRLEMKEEQPHRSIGLILLVGTGQSRKGPMDQSALDAIKYHQQTLKYCWLVGSEGENGSEAAVKALMAECHHIGITAFTYFVSDPFSIQESFALVQKLYAEELPRVNLSEEQVVADITGATKPMSFGMLRACGTRRTMQYMIRQPSGPSTPIMLRYSLGEVD